MAEFAHSIVLFSGEDGLPLEFNIQNTVEKESLRAVIEYGGGLCTLSDGAIYLVSPGTKVLNVDPSKKLISTKYIFDCVKENYLLDTDEYRISINELETSDISDNSDNLVENLSNRKKNPNSLSDSENSVDILETNKLLSPNSPWVESNHAFDFEDSENPDKVIISNKEIESGCSHLEIPLKSVETHIKINVSEKTKIASTNLNNDVPDSFDSVVNLDNMEQDLLVTEMSKISADRNKDTVTHSDNSPASPVIVSSSQSDENLDQFDNAVLKKVNENPIEKDKESLSQSYTVSSSADAQVSPKQQSHNTSAEIFGGSSAGPNSANQTIDRQQYIKNLEREVHQILQKPRKTVEDKAVLVKYICCVKGMSPDDVLRTLRNF